MNTVPQPPPTLAELATDPRPRGATRVVEVYANLDDYGPVGVLATLYVCSLDCATVVAEPWRAAGRVAVMERTGMVAECVACAQAADRAKLVAASDDDRAQLVDGLRQLADWYEASGAPLPKHPKFSHCVYTKDDAAGRATVAEVAAALGVDHDATAYRPDTSRKFAAIEFEAFYVPEEDMAAYSAKQDAIRELVAAGWKPGDLVPTPAADPLAYSREVDGEVTGAPLPPGVEGIPVSSPPHNTGRPVSAPPAPASVDPMHVGRAFAGNRVERTCGCQLAACGLVDATGTDPGCPHHPVERGETMRQMHRASQCPAMRGPR